MIGWPAVITAISAALIALTVVAGGAFGLVWMRRLTTTMLHLERLAAWLEREAAPTLEASKGMLEDSAKVMSLVRREVEEFAETADELRDGARRVGRNVERRLQELDALVEVVQEEIEDTALDIASALRTTRRGTRVFRKMKRAFLGRSR